jgi:hypothetical protein
VLVFHGSDTKIEEIDLSKSEYFKDFGRGFYVTNIREQAYARAIDITRRHGLNRPVITEFNYIETYPNTVGLNIKKFENVSKEWVEFIILNRNRRISHPAHVFDIVEGPIANDKMVIQIRLYELGRITIDNLIERLTYREPTHQICFCTLASLYALEIVENKDFYSAIDEKTGYILERIIIDFNLNESEAIKFFYGSNFYEKLSDPNTLLWEKPWQQIYEIFKQNE